MASTSRTQKVWLNEGNFSKRLSKPERSGVNFAHTSGQAASLSWRLRIKGLRFPSTTRG